MRRYMRQIRDSSSEPTREEAARIDRVWERYERRRGLPRRQRDAALAQAWRGAWPWLVLIWLVFVVIAIVDWLL